MDVFEISYNNRGGIIDALLVGSFFCYEDVARFSEFIINRDYTINIYKYFSYLYKVDENGLIGKVEHPEKNFYSKEKYKIQHGLFELMEDR